MFLRDFIEYIRDFQFVYGILDTKVLDPFVKTSHNNVL